MAVRSSHHTSWAGDLELVVPVARRRAEGLALLSLQRAATHPNSNNGLSRPADAAQESVDVDALANTRVVAGLPAASR